MEKLEKTRADFNKIFEEVHVELENLKNTKSIDYRIAFQGKILSKETLTKQQEKLRCLQQYTE